MVGAREAEILSVAGREVAISHPGKVLFPQPKHTKLDLARYYVAVAEGALRGAGGRPNMLVRYPNGIEGEHFYQKRAPQGRPDWIEVVELSFPSGRRAEEVVPRDAAALAWLANLACLELHPHPVRADDLDHPDELRVDLDPVPGITWKQIQAVAEVARAVLEDFKLTGWPKTSGSRGIHICVRIERRWDFDQVRRAALALAREVEARAPKLATSKWWKEERHGVFVSMPARFRELGDLHAGIDQHAGSIDGLLALFDRQGQGEAPWPPHFRKQAAEPPRVQPSKRKQASKSPPAQRSRQKSSSRRKSSMPLIEIGRARLKEDALAGLERWKARHPQAAAHLQPADILVDAMRGRYTTWTRIRLNLQHVPEVLRPAQEPPDPDEKILSSS
jgi:bifunctional non-homologous end joining protein LigD